jgi:hypothetical protein
MSLVIIFTNSNGGVSVTTPTGEISIEKVQQKDTPSGSIIVDRSILPTGASDSFFKAWELSGSTVTVNFAKAIALTKTRLRIERAHLLAAQDVAYQRATEVGGDTTAIVAEKNRLRDITLLADKAVTLEELVALKCN